MWLLLKVIIFNLAVSGVLLGWLPWHLLQGSTPPPLWSLHHLVACPLLLAGGLLYAQSLWSLALVGRGTPLPFDPPRKLVQRGPYRWVRNPLYLAIGLILCGEALFFFNLYLLLYTVFVASGLQLLVVLHEEAALRRRFGAMYSDYCHQVPRWWPRRPPARSTALLSSSSLAKNQSPPPLARVTRSDLRQTRSDR